ncbi:MAG TPA: SDR family oxidoreductase [Polyangiaceae bacterium]|nr:SDR family oxidoreductase [Polyangiaceae bacterium]
MSSLSGRHCVVTGATSGIGRATALALLSAGASVTGLGRSREKLVALAEQAGQDFDFLVADLAVDSELERVSEALRQSSRPIDVFVSNAGEAAYASPLAISPAHFRHLLQLNVCAPLELCQALVPRMSASGHVVQLSSVAGRFLPNAKFGPYGVTKAAVTGLIDALRLEVASRGIRVTSIVPGLVDTPIYDDVEGFDDLRKKLDEQVPHWLTPEDVAETITWVLSRPANVVVTELTVMPRGQAR